RDATCDSSSNPLCVSKCCEDGLEFDEEWECTLTNNSQLSPATFLGSREDVDISKLQYVYGFPTGCNEDDLIVHEYGPFHLLQDGSMYSVNGSHAELTTRYCLEYIPDMDEVMGIYCTPLEEEPEPEQCSWHKDVYPILMIFSIFFLILTLGVYAAVPNLRSRTSGRCLISLVTALLVFYIIQTSAYYVDTMHHHHTCITMAFFLHFTGLTVFFWLNVMAFNIWSGVRYCLLCNFFYFSLYAWGCPLLISTITLIIDHLPDHKHILKPNLVGERCFLEGTKAIWVYFYWVILLINLVNLYFIIHVWYIVYKTNKTVGKEDSSIPMFLKMFLIMGVTWILEIPSGGACWWVLADFFNLLQGVSIFIATVCTKSTYKEVVNWWSPYKSKIMYNFKPAATTELASVSGSTSSTNHGYKATEHSDQSRP
ncbi:unnamed protein product, partial [Meganyctiphanes norvegica]